ncbi:CLUMA_CG004916, isoform A [Clunio marinus]|uniref:CLUMA_CG004916, isoform A n=1 Tax=Clunio marinus TaxID=568069 RepID=A0A1J1HUL8_9DIPT|nr:CLUMA_CG004916, isoform A [Clunio marinus]
MGIPRGALHQALSNPHIYMQCSCCKIPEQERILPSLPDISIVYKLHLECNKFINEDHISPEVQAHFTRSIAELQFLGFIKQSKHKTDTAARLT